VATDDPEDPTPRADDDAVVDPSPSGVATTAARALALGAALTSSDALLGIEEDLPEVGIERLPPYWGGWEDRQALFERSDAILAEHDVLADVRNREQPDGPIAVDDGAVPERDPRRLVWAQVASEPTPENAVAFLRMLMTDNEPVASAAAAAALSHWRHDRRFPPPEALTRAKQLTRAHSQSRSLLAREIASAALGDWGKESAGASITVSQRVDSELEDTLSTIVHGTLAYTGNWWYPGGDFHTHVKAHLRPDLYSGGQAYSWSGRYKRKDRAVAAERLARWAEEARPGGLNAVFAHSYGGVIALHATTFGLRMKDAVLLSVPAEPVAIEWRNVKRATSLRIHFDLVLLAARRRQRFTENVEEYYLPKWFREHADSHSPTVWRGFKSAELLQL
jgi:hypothetical protein